MLVSGLPREAAVWRDENDWTIREELTAILVERVDYWGRAQFQGLGGKVRGEALHIPRPDEVEAEKERRKIVTDPGQIARFFGAHLAASDAP